MASLLPAGSTYPGSQGNNSPQNPSNSNTATASADSSSANIAPYVPDACASS